ncbi:MAG TPA: amino acid adenylation domain-containing protein [Gemmatimonadales bacterium]|nr:amino acid adenylation domain-containing protein [Gemmatimonadales bacterium]
MGFLLWHGLRDSVRRFADRPAIEWRREVLTYRQLDELSNAVAHVLREAGVGPGHRVGLYMPKTHRSVVAMLGISKAGAAYVPIDPHAPALRAAYILGDCAVTAVVASADRLESLAEHRESLTTLKLAIVTDGVTQASGGSSWVEQQRWNDLKPSSEPVAEPAVETDPAYLLYTSGSTGKPKGVIITHRNALTFIDWGAETFKVGPEDRLSNHAPLHFDLSVFDIYVSLLTGACVVLVPEQIAPFPGELAKWINDRRISVWYSVPSALVRMLLHGKMSNVQYDHLRVVLFAGEVFPQKYLLEVMRLLPRAEFYNLYGPTETNVCTFYHVPHDIDPAATCIPVGAACANTEVFAVDPQGRVTGVGEEGELLVRGGTVMAGYWGLPEKTAQMLIRNPLQPAFEDRVYRTGDIVRLAEDGNYFFIGRRDHMVKSRGYRIELGEIEQVLHSHERVKEAAVVPVPDEEIGARLKAFVAPQDGRSLTEDELKSFCLARLPHYMVPETFDIMGELPKTSTGKTDRQSLAQSLKKGAAT